MHAYVICINLYCYMNWPLIVWQDNTTICVHMYINLTWKEWHDLSQETPLDWGTVHVIGFAVDWCMEGSRETLLII